MSLKHIKEALDRLGRTRVDDLGEMDRMMRGALAEVEAIERAARQFHYDGAEANVGAWVLMDAIAEENRQS